MEDPPLLVLAREGEARDLGAFHFVEEGSHIPSAAQRNSHRRPRQEDVFADRASSMRLRGSLIPPPPRRKLGARPRLVSASERPSSDSPTGVIEHARVEIRQIAFAGTRRWVCAPQNGGHRTDDSCQSGAAHARTSSEHQTAAAACGSTARPSFARLVDAPDDIFCRTSAVGRPRKSC